MKLINLKWADFRVGGEIIKWYLDQLDPFLKSPPAGGLFVYPVPRGGVVPALILAWRCRDVIIADSPDDAHVVIDDIIHSGQTAQRFKDAGIPFIAPKLADYILWSGVQGGEWVNFPWESGVESDREDSIRRLLQSFGLNLDSDGLRDTPRRVATMYAQLLIPQEYSFTTFPANGYNQIIISKGIRFHSLCEHHMMPFFGEMSVGYLPDKKIVGLSKIARCITSTARGLHTQEYLTQAIAEILMNSSDFSPKGVAVVAKARHLCQEMRGVQREGEMRTSCLRGVFLDDSAAKAEFFKLIEES